MTSTLPCIGLTGRALRDVSDEALAALLAANGSAPRIFARGGAISRIRVDESGRPTIDQVDDHALRRELARAADFTRTVKGGQEVTAHPPVEVVRDVRAHPDPPFPPLVGVVESPVLRPDGTIHAGPGYDPATRLVHVPQPGLEVPVVPEEPDEREVRAAVAVLLDDTLGDFPFASEASAAGALALMLTPVVRPAIEGNVPLALLDATKAGTGKGLLASVAATIATGRPAAVLPAPTREEEWAKTISAQVVGGSTFNLFDEVRELDSPTFAAALTSRVFDARMLGRTEVVRVAQRSTWVAAGNNVAVGGDLARRTYRIRLDAQVSRPWRRNGWRHPDLESWVVGNRGRLLAALLTLARAYFAAGRPKAEIAPLGGFDAWAQTIGGILAHAGVPGFLTDLEDFYDEADAESAAWQAFLDGCAGAFGDAAWQVGELARAIDASEALKELLPSADLGEALDRSARSFTAKLGKALSARNGTRFGDHGVRVEKVGVDPRSGSARWAIRAEVAPVTSAEANRAGEPDVG